MDNFRDRKRPASNFKLSDEVAQQQLATLLDHYDIYPGDFDDNDKRLYCSACDGMIVAIRSGRVSIDKADKLTVTQTLKNGEKINYSEVDGRSRVQDKEQASRSDRVFSMMGSLSGLGYSAILGLKGTDLTTMNNLSFLLASV